MAHIHKRCPYCWRLYDSTGPGVTHVGSPLRQCAKCKGTFIDRDYIEPFFADPPQMYTLWKLLLVFLWPFGLIGITLCGIAPQTESLFMYILAALSVGFYLFLVIRGYCKREQAYEAACAEHWASRERLMDRDYVILLLDNKCRVPAIFLAHYHPDLVNYRPKNAPSTQNIHNTFIH